MRISVLQHADFEGPGEIAAWAADRKHEVLIHHLYRGEALPRAGEFDLLVIMGGEQNIYQDRDWPWLKAERAFIADTLSAGAPTIGICLGAQFLADALGARVVQNSEVELGWYSVTWTKEARAASPDLPETTGVLHWHGDTFGLPEGATRLASSPACPEQGFVIPGKCLALQFHMEVDLGLVHQFIESQGQWPRGSYVQDPKAIAVEAAAHCDRNRELLHGMLDRFCANL